VSGPGRAASLVDRDARSWSTQRGLSYQKLLELHGIV
jgi:hypothetical protein